MKIFGLLLCCTLVLTTDLEKDENPIVNATAGSFCGSILKSQLGRDIYAFRGIRYGEAPTGHNRFKPAIPVKCHEGTFDATERGPICPQPNAESHEMSEDCLRLDIYTTALPDESHQPNRPVLAFLNRGIIETPSGPLTNLGPEITLDQDLVFVSISYRVGPFGFLCTGDEHAPGNVGLKDQVMALRWVQENIAAFGGDPNKVTLHGHSDTAMDATLHIVSPMSKGLFHQALVANGAATTQRPYPPSRKDLVEIQAKLLGCPTDNLDEMFDCLYEKPAEEYIKSNSQLIKLSDEPIGVWTPVIEQLQHDEDECDDDVELFLTDQPEDLIRKGNCNFVPIFIGSNLNEYGYISISAEEQAQCGDTTMYDALNNDWEELGPKYFGYERGTPRSRYISKELKSFYFNDEPLKVGSNPRLAKLDTDALSVFHVHRFQDLMITHSSQPVFSYLYNYPNADTVARWSNGSRFGIVHHDEMTLTFNVEGRPEHTEEDLKIAQNVWEFIFNFAKYGHPTPEDKTKKYPVKWEPSTKDKPQYFNFMGDHVEMVCGFLYQDRMAKWDELFPIESDDSTECDD